MKETLWRLLQAPKILTGVIAALLAGLALLGLGALDRRSEISQLELRIVEAGTEIVELEERVVKEREDRDQLVRADRGFGPGGIRSELEGLLFGGPTAARSALELVLRAEGAGFHRLRYDSEEPRTLAMFPPGGDDPETASSDSRPANRDRIEFVEWPIRLSVESDWASIVDLTGRLTGAQPSFALRFLEIGVTEDAQGRIQDGLALEAGLSTYWLEGEDGS